VDGRLPVWSFTINPSSLDLLGAEIELVSRLGRETILKRLLKSVEGKYDYVLIDCAPALGMLTVNALVAADTVMIPLEAEYFAYRGIDRLISIISDVRTHYNENLTIGGVFITKINPRRVITEQITESIKKYFSDKLFQTSIRVNVALVEAQLKGVDVFEYAPASNAAVDYANLTDEIVEKI
jgi:chromosome partitioning protein